jgi:hypothetical protein
MAIENRSVDGERVKRYSRPGKRSCILGGAAVACGENGIACFDRIRHGQHDPSVFLYTFDLIELNGDDLRRDPLEVRKVTLASVLAKAGPGIRFNEDIEGDGPTVFAHACRMGSKASPRSVRARPIAPGARPTGLKMKNPACAAVKREAEEDWSIHHPWLATKAEGVCTTRPNRFSMAAARSRTPPSHVRKTWHMCLTARNTCCASTTFKPSASNAA